MRRPQAVEKLHVCNSLVRAGRCRAAGSRDRAAPRRPNQGCAVGTVVGVSIAVFDIDGVVADVRHRLHLLERKPKDWPAFFAAAGDDVSLDEGIDRVRAAVAEHEIVWLTGRPSSLRAVTQSWLTDRGLPVAELIMRGPRDFRPAPVLKLAELNKLRSRQVELFVDDDVRVIEAAVVAGFPAVLADWMTSSPALSQAQDQAGRT